MVCVCMDYDYAICLFDFIVIELSNITRLVNQCWKQQTSSAPFTKMG